jgi:hypothetical protein
MVGGAGQGYPEQLGSFNFAVLSPIFGDYFLFLDVDIVPLRSANRHACVPSEFRSSKVKAVL